MMSGAGTVLLVEDNTLVRMTIAAMLKTIGYRVLPAETPQDALAICDKNETPIDLLITDVVMPGMSGTELRDRIEATRPGLKVLFMSGYTPHIIVDLGMLKEGAQFIQKPFSMEELARRVREVIGDG